MADESAAGTLDQDVAQGDDAEDLVPLLTMWAVAVTAEMHRLHDLHRGIELLFEFQHLQSGRCWFGANNHKNITAAEGGRPPTSYKGAAGHRGALPNQSRWRSSWLPPSAPDQDRYATRALRRGTPKEARRAGEAVRGLARQQPPGSVERRAPFRAVRR
jgi:hypothetical protein